MRTHLLALSAGLTLFAAACGGTSGTSTADMSMSSCKSDARAETYKAGMSKTGAHFMVHLANAAPAPPAVGTNDWTLMVMDPKTDMMTSGAAVTVTATRLDDASQAAVTVTATEGMDAGMYMAPGIKLPAAGLWSFAIAVDDKKGSTETASFVFCL